MALSGFSECTCWPGVVSTMGNWFGRKNRGFIFSLWVGCKNCGDLLGFLLIGKLVLGILNLSWTIGFFIIAFLLFITALLNYYYLNPYPSKKQLIYLNKLEFS
jgi:sugar phosphate permease